MATRAVAEQTLPGTECRIHSEPVRPHAGDRHVRDCDGFARQAATKGRHRSTEGRGGDEARQRVLSVKPPSVLSVKPSSLGIGVHGSVV